MDSKEDEKVKIFYSNPVRCVQKGGQVNSWNGSACLALTKQQTSTIEKIQKVAFRIIHWEQYNFAKNNLNTQESFFTKLQTNMNTRTNKTEVESVQLENTYFADMDKCPQDKCCLDKCRGDSSNLLYMFPGPFV